MRYRAPVQSRKNRYKRKEIPSPILVDTTMRDGEQAPGVVFSLAEKTRILKYLKEAGIQEVEIGTPSIGAAEQRDIAFLVHSGKALDMKLFCWCRAGKADIDAATKTGCDGIHISLPVSDIQMRVAGMTENHVLRRMRETISYAHKKFSRISVGAQDATRADTAFLMEYADASKRAGAFRIRLADTVGTALPDKAAGLVRLIKQRHPALQVEFHAHNDYGMAVSNSICALEAGADAVSVTVLGLGERAGNAPLETVLLAAKHLAKRDMPYNAEVLYPLCEYVARAAGRPIPPAQPVVGSAVMTHESGIHINGQIADPACYQPFAAADVGRAESGFLYSKMSGRAAAAQLFRKAGLSPSESGIAELLEKISFVSTQKKRSLLEAEVMEMLRS